MKDFFDMDKDLERLKKRTNVDIVVNIIALVMAIVGAVASAYLWYRIFTFIF